MLKIREKNSLNFNNKKTIFIFVHYFLFLRFVL